MVIQIISAEFQDRELNAAYYTGYEVEAESLEAAVPEVRKILRDHRGLSHLRIIDLGDQDERRIYIGWQGQPRFYLQEKYVPQPRGWERIEADAGV